MIDRYLDKRHRVEMTAAVLLIALGLAVGWTAAYGQSAFRSGFEGGESAGAPACPEPPAGRTAVTKAWSWAWKWPNNNNIPAYPNSGGYPIPVGANKATYTVIPFVPLPNQAVKVDWDVAQGSSVIGYLKARPADSMYFVISPCAGDFRPQGEGDPFLKAGCRRGGNAGAILFHTLTGPPSNFQFCQLVAGQQYYMMIVAANPEDGMDPDEHTCVAHANSTAGCDVNAVHQAIF